MKKEEFIRRSNEKHNSKYTYINLPEEFTTKIKVTVVCKVHGAFEQNVSNHMNNGQGCKQCGYSIDSQKNKTNVYNTVELIERSKELFDNLDYSKTIFTRVMDNSIFICKEHNLEFSQMVRNHLKGSQGCSICKGIANAKYKSIDDVKDFIEKKFNVIITSITCDDLPIGRESKISFTTTDNFHYTYLAKRLEMKDSLSEYTVVPDHTKDLPIVYGSRASNIIDRFNSIHDNKYDYSLVDFDKCSLKGSTSAARATIICPTHGNFEQRLREHIEGRGCPKCGTETRLKENGTYYDFDLFLEKTNDVLFSNNYDYSYTKEFYKDRSFFTIPIPFKCIKHDRVFNQKPEHHLSSAIGGCPICSKQTSKQELIVEEILESLGVAYTKNDRTTIVNPKSGKFLELDFYIPESNLAIECHGLYFHSEKFKKDEAINSHFKIKNDLCKEKNITLLQFYEDEVINKKEIVQKIIEIRLNISTNKVYARNTEVTLLDQTITDTFLDKYHLQGKTKAKHNYGLIDKKTKELLAVMCFSYQVSNRGTLHNTTHFELVRFASKNQVVGGASKLLNAFLTDFEDVIEITSYSDNRFSEGNLYKILGFELEHEIKPDYTYIRKHELKRFHKSGFRHSSIKHKFENYDQSLTEVANCTNNGFYRIFDAGKIKWVLN